jgi:hypothetical protein
VRGTSNAVYALFKAVALDIPTGGPYLVLPWHCRPIYTRYIHPGYISSFSLGHTPTSSVFSQHYEINIQIVEYYSSSLLVFFVLLLSSLVDRCP